MASGSKRTEQANARAKALGFASDYDRRKARLAAQGTTPRKARNASEARRGVSRDYWAESVAREKRAKQLGFESEAARRRAKAKGLAGKELEAFQRDAMLRHFGLTKRQFDRLRFENKYYSTKFTFNNYTDINTYRDEVDGDIHNWSEQRVGYIIFYHAAIVAPATNYDALAMRPGWFPGSEKSRKLPNKELFYYFTKYANIMSINEFEARYGRVN